MTQKPIIPDRVDIFGTKLSAVDLKTATKLLTEKKIEEPGYVCFPSTGTIIRALDDKKFQHILNNSILSFADGKFTEHYARIKGNKGVKNVSGYWLMINLLKTDRSHFFYGADEKTLALLKNKLTNKFNKANILGFKAPPMMQINEIESNQQIVNDFREINHLNPDFVWVGISSPKQDYLMHHCKKHLNKGVLIGVGAVFLYHAGVVNKGPEIFKKLALRWLFRLLQEPRRIIKKGSISFLVRFIILIIKHDVLRIKFQN